MRQHHRHPRN